MHVLRLQRVDEGEQHFPRRLLGLLRARAEHVERARQLSHGHGARARHAGTDTRSAASPRARVPRAIASARARGAIVSNVRLRAPRRNGPESAGGGLGLRNFRRVLGGRPSRDNERTPIIQTSPAVLHAQRPERSPKTTPTPSPRRAEETDVLDRPKAETPRLLQGHLPQRRLHDHGARREVLRVLHKNETEATFIMLTVHKKGSAVAATYTRDVAETKVQKSPNAPASTGCPSWSPRSPKKASRHHRLHGGRSRPRSLPIACSSR